MLSVTGEFVAIGRVVVEHQQWIAGLRHQRPTEHMHFPPQESVQLKVRPFNAKMDYSGKFWNFFIFAAGAA